MQKSKENPFTEKFQLLNSQEQGEDINWSCSDSSDYENVSNNERLCNITNKVHTRKRKRKKKVPKNVSNLDVTILDAKDIQERKQSPVLQKKNNPKSPRKSPVFAPTPLFFPPFKCSKVEQSSPILTCKVTEQNRANKSPILLCKYSSPKVSPKVRKNLFKAAETCQEIKQEYDSHNNNNDRQDSEEEIKQEIQDSPGSSNINIRQSDENLLLDRRKSDSFPNIINIINTIKTEINDPEENNASQLKSAENSINQQNEDDDSFKMLKTENIDLVKRVKSYFDSQFSSGTTSQYSISDSLTQQNSKTSDEVDIISFVTQMNSNRASSQTEQEYLSKNPSPLSSQSAEINDKPKKIRYKKDGLAFRLNAILKKQNANISLWQHERFLAENSNFVIPKGEHLIFQILKVDFKYGCYLLDVVDVNNICFIILINSSYVDNVKIAQNMILKLYEPYKIVDFKENCQLIFNACKLETVSLSQ